MTKQEWNEKWENRPREDLFSTQADFFYSLHLQELSKIREKFEKEECLCVDAGILCEHDGIKRILLAITDDNNGN